MRIVEQKAAKWEPREKPTEESEENLNRRQQRKRRLVQILADDEGEWSGFAG
jgi:hypothetical protein